MKRKQRTQPVKHVTVAVEVAALVTDKAAIKDTNERR